MRTPEVSIVGDGRYRVTSPGGGHVTVTIAEVRACARQVGGEGLFWADVLELIESHEDVR